jgi:glycosyltransferase involved in cell wall biosynthesis
MGDKIRCLVCDSECIQPRFNLSEYQILECKECLFQFINPQPSIEVLGKIYGEDYFVLASNNEDMKHVSDLKRATADKYLDKLLENSKISEGKYLLEIGCGNGDFLYQAANRGLEVEGIEYSSHASGIAWNALLGNNAKIFCGELADYVEKYHGYKFDFIVFCDVIEHVRDPREFLKNLYELLKTDGQIFCITPSLDSLYAKILKNKWMEYKAEHLYYFNEKTLNALMFQSGFREIEIFSSKKILSIDYIVAHFRKHYIPLLSHLVLAAYRIFPKSLTRKKIQIYASGIGLIAKKVSSDRLNTVTIVLPVYNEISTIKNTLERVISKRVKNVNIDLIIVESNSTDGSKEVVKSYANNPRVRVIYQDYPKGKGNAVREALKVATGSVILIQDADDEYDVNDYDSLLEPVISGKEFFILGSRHGNSGWKIRKFTDAPLKAFILNVGHLFFTELLNICNGVRLKDPFTMYKIFRKDCLNGIALECDRFDFDHEIVIKLIRAGYTPKEIQINYKSRSFTEGKKVTMIRDPITWVIAIIKYSFFSSGKL